MSKPLAADFAAKGKAYLDTPYDTLDCQALLEAMLKDVGIRKNWKGSNDMYRDMAWVGTPEACKQRFGCIPVGAWIFILKHDGKEPAEYRNDGIGNADHVGVKTGTGKGAIHSSYSKDVVCESTFKDKTIANGGWNQVGFCRLLDYGSQVESILYGAAESEIPEEKKPEKISYEPDEEVTIAMTTATVKTSGGILNIRETPFSRGRDLGDIPNGATVEVLEKTSDDWWKVIYAGITGYCAREYLVEVQNVNLTISMDTACALYRALNEVLVD